MAALGLHSVRESALGAYLDLTVGVDERAGAALGVVLQQQYHAPGRPWDATFRVTAEQADPPEQGAVEWLHYDPNWRQFLGVTLALVLIDHGPRLDATLRGRVSAAVVAAARGESEDRIPEWYTNPNLLHAWLQAWAGRHVGDENLAERGLVRARRCTERLERLGDVDEYNSPTYDGIDLFAAGLWCAVPPDPAFPALGRRFVQVLTERIAQLYAPHLGAICGPHLRAYGLDPTRYVSLLGLWLLLAGEPAERVLPPVLDATTVHVHDLFFLPLFERVGTEVLPGLHLFGDPPQQPRRRVQHFDGIIAESHVGATVALGAERGRTPDFSRDQYVPVTVHTADDSGAACWLGLLFGPTTTHIDATITAGDEVQVGLRTDGAERTDVVVLSSMPPRVTGPTVAVGSIRMELDLAPSDVVTEPTATGYRTTLWFDPPEGAGAGATVAAVGAVLSVP